MAKPVLFTEKQARRIEAAVREVERGEESTRRNPAPSYKPGSGGIPGVVLGYEVLSANRWLYRIQITGLKWSPSLHRYIVATAANKKELVWAVNRYEANNTSTTFGPGIPTAQGTSTLTPLPIPPNDQVSLDKQVGTYNDRPEHWFYGVNRLSVVCG